MKRKTLLFILGLVCYIPIFAATAERIKVGDLYYNIIDKTNKQVEVTYDVYQSSTNYTGLINVSIPETILYDDVTYSVVGIGSSSFRDCSTLVAITIPHSITYIESAAFEYCEQIVSVVIPNSVYKIGYHAFCNATKLSTITFPDTINEMGAGSFAGTAWYKSKPNGIVYAGNVLYYYKGIPSGNIVVKEGTRTICAEAFYGNGAMKNDAITSVSLPNTLKYIGEAAFKYCQGLTTVNMSDSLISIGKEAFYACSALASITLPQSLTEIQNTAFQDCIGLTSLSLPDSLKVIGENAFYHCATLTSIRIPKSVTAIGSGAFSNCSRLTSVVWNAPQCGGWTSYKGAPFYNIASQIISFTFGNEVENIPMGLCYNMKSLTSISIPESVKSIGAQVFTNCSGISTITIPKSVSIIGDNCFSGCTGLTSITWNAPKCGGWTSYKYAPFYNIASQITSFTFGNEVDSIPASLCYNMKGLTSVSIPESVTSIGASAFANCSSISSITIPKSVSIIKNGCFSGCIGLISIIWNAPKCGGWTSSGNAPFYNIASQITAFTFGNEVDSVPMALCYNMSNLAAVTIPNSVTSIGNEAFAGCLGLTSITIPESVISIGASAFSGCTGLTSIVIPNSVKSIGNSAFSSCSNLTSVTMGEGVTDIGSSVFYNCTGITSVTWNAIKGNWHSSTSLFDASRSKITSFIFGEKVEVIPSELCYYMSGLTSIIIPKSVIHIASSAFNTSGITSVVWNAKKCGGWDYYNGAPFIEIASQITSFVFGNEVDSIPMALCADMYNLDTIAIPESVTGIGASAFSGCSGLTSITIPENVTDIGEDAFYDCRNIITTRYAGDIAGWCNIQFGNATANPICDSENLYINDELVTTLQIPAGVTRIGDYAFYNCKDLTSVTIPESVTHIGNYAFYGCTGLTSVTIPAGVTRIGDYAFYNCKGIRILEIPDSVMEIGSDAFYGISAVVYAGTATGSPWGAQSVVDGSPSGWFTFEDEAQTILKRCNIAVKGDVVIPGTVTTIKSGAFNGCTGITSITIPENVTSIGNSLFSGCTGLTSVVWNAKKCGGWASYKASPFNVIASQITSFIFGNEVDSIPMALCADMTNLETITIPESVTGIGASAFAGCSGITSVTIPENVTTLGRYAFQRCPKLTSVVWNAKNCEHPLDTYYAHEQTAFYQDTAITSFTFGDGVETIPAYICRGMKYLQSVTIPASVTNIGNNAFQGCESLLSVTIPENVTNMGANVFYGCKNITSVTWNAKRCSIPFGSGQSYMSAPFYNIASQITSFTFGNMVDSIPAYLCYDMNNAFSITIPDDVTEIGEKAFYNVYNIQYNGTATGSPWGAKTVGGYIEGYIMYESEAKTTVVKCHPAATGAIVLPESVTTIEASAFSGCEGITGITIPENVTTIGKDAFYGCKNMSSVVWNAKNCAGYFSGSVWLGASIFSVGFEFPSTVTTFTIGPAVEYLPKYVCYGLTNITEIVIPENVKVIGRGAFCGCTSLTSVTFPSSEIGIEGGHDYYSSSGFREPWPCGVFQNTGLKSITIPDNVTSTGEATFSACDSLTTVIIGKGIDTIGESAFERCPLLTTVVLPDSLTMLSSEAFRECKSLTSITLPSALTNISSDCFRWCSSLSSIVIPDKVKKIENYAFSDCGSLASVSFGNGLTTIGAYAFSNDSNLTELVIQENVTYLGNSVFFGCSGLTSITIPEDVTYIGDCAFQNCTSLASITSEAIEPPATRSGDYYNSFQTLPHDIPVYVPCGGYELYLASNWGSYFSNIQAPVPPFALYAWSESDAEGSVAIDKTQQCAGVGYLTATPEEGYEFVQWNDGNTDNPRTVELTQDTSFVAEFDVIKSGKCGDDLYWTYRDGEISITGTGAMYDYTVDTQPWPLLRNNITAVSICNTATYIGTYAFADCGALRAVRFEEGICAYIADYAFSNCYSLDTLVIPDYSYAAATIGAYAFKNCSGLRSVSLGTSVQSVGKQAFYGCYGLNELSIYSRCSLDDQAFAECPSLSHIYNYNAVPNTCNSSVFDGLDKFSCTLHVPQGSTDKYRIASVWRDFYYMEEIVPTYTVSVETASADWGSVTGGGAYLSGTEITLRAVPATGYRFVRWNDGNTDNPRTVTVTEDATYTAVFDVLQLLVTVLPSNDSHGVVTGGGWYNYGETTVLEATPATGYWFYCWQDGSKDNPRTVTVTEDITYTATFRPYTFTVSATADDASRGEVTGSGTYGYGDIATLDAIAYTGYRFTQWSDGNTDNPRTIVLTQDTVLTAIFDMVTYDVTLSCDAEQGTVSGSGTYREGEQVTISATPNEGYEFVQWSDSNTDNPRSWIVTEDVSLSAIFQPVTALPQTTAASQETQKVVKDGQVLILRNGKAYDMLGQEIR